MLGATYGYFACPDCGITIPVNQREVHVCDLEPLIAKSLSSFRKELDSLETALVEWSASKTAEFNRWLEEKGRI